MSGQSWWQRFTALIEREYERRIRRASLLGEFKPPGDDHHHGHAAEPAHTEQTAEDEAIIVNVPRGTRINRS